MLRPSGDVRLPALRWLAARGLAWLASVAVLAAATVAALGAVEGRARVALASARARRHLTAGTPAEPIALTDGVVVRQLLVDDLRGLCGIRVGLASAPAAVAAPLAWRLVRLPVAGDHREVVREGVVAPRAGDEWLGIDFPPLAATAADRHVLRIDAPTGSAAQPLALALDHAAAPVAPPSVKGTAAAPPPAAPPAGTCLRVKLVWAGDGAGA